VIVVVAAAGVVVAAVAGVVAADYLGAGELEEGQAWGFGWRKAGCDSEETDAVWE
jgi:hypothetical protein